MTEAELFENIRFNLIQGRIEAEDEGFEEGLEGQPAVAELVQEAVDQNIPPKTILLEALTPAMEEVGVKFEQGEFLIPDMLASAECMGAGMEILKPLLLKDGVESKGTFIIATVAGDLHDIGKNIVATLLKGEGYDVVDLGTDVSTERIISEVKDRQAPFLGLSALLTTTMQNMDKIIEGLKEAGIRESVKVFVGGAPVSSEFAEKIKADAYCSDAFAAIDNLRRQH